MCIMFIVQGSLEQRLENKNRVLVQAMKNALGVYAKKDKDQWKKDVEKSQVRNCIIYRLNEVQWSWMCPRALFHDGMTCSALLPRTFI